MNLACLRTLASLAAQADLINITIYLMVSRKLVKFNYIYPLIATSNYDYTIIFYQKITLKKVHLINSNIHAFY